MERLTSAVWLLLFGGLCTFLFVGPLTVLLVVFLVRVPRQHRQISLPRLWLLAVPLWHIVWIYVAVTSVSKSFQRYFAAQGRRERDDCGYRIGLALVFSVWGMASAPLLAHVFRWRRFDIVFVAAGLLVFALFGAYVVRMLGAARAMT